MFLFYKSSLHIAVENEDELMVQLLLNRKNIDINALSILKQLFLFNFILCVFLFYFKYFVLNVISKPILNKIPNYFFYKMQPGYTEEENIEIQIIFCVMAFHSLIPMKFKVIFILQNINFSFFIKQLFILLFKRKIKKL